MNLTALNNTQKTILVVGGVLVTIIAINAISKGFNEAESQVGQGVSSVGSGIGTGAALAGGGLGIGAILFVLLL